MSYDKCATLRHMVRTKVLVSGVSGIVDGLNSDEESKKYYLNDTRTYYARTTAPRAHDDSGATIDHSHSKHFHFTRP